MVERIQQLLVQCDEQLLGSGGSGAAALLSPGRESTWVGKESPEHFCGAAGRCPGDCPCWLLGSPPGLAVTEESLE